MRNWIAIVVLLALPATRELTRPSPPPPSRRETLAGSWSRAAQRLERVNRQDAFDRVNEGARGRSNATRDAARAGENFPGTIDRTLSSW